jgi:hypothetical protein
MKRLRRLFLTVNRHVAAMAIEMLDEQRRMRLAFPRSSRMLVETAIDVAIYQWTITRWTPKRPRPDRDEVLYLVTRKGKGRVGDLAQLTAMADAELLATVRNAPPE